MSLPIGRTPILRGKEAVKFLTMIHEDAQKPVHLIPTPKLEEAHKLIKKHEKRE